MPKKKPYRSNLKRIKLLLLDVDGVMTDGGVYYSGTGDEQKKFNIQDGYGIVKAQREGIKVGIITGRVSAIVKRRATELGIVEVHEGVEEKGMIYHEIKSRLGLSDGEIAYIGDDEPDLPVLQQVGFSAAPADALEVVRRTVAYVCKRSGGKGAVREVIEKILAVR